jgi:hypothetical protein
MKVLNYKVLVAGVLCCLSSVSVVLAAKPPKPLINMAPTYIQPKMTGNTPLAPKKVFVSQSKAPNTNYSSGAQQGRPPYSYHHHRPTTPVVVNFQAPQATQPVAGYYPQPMQPVFAVADQSYTPYAAAPNGQIDNSGTDLLNANQARILAEQARELAIENNRNEREAVLEHRQRLAEARMLAREEQEVRVAETRQRLAERRATAHRKAYKLSTSELNPITGAISWPAALQNEGFKANRVLLGDLFTQFVSYRENRAEVANQIAQEIDAWSRALRNEIGTMPREEYLAAQKFLLCLKYAATETRSGAYDVVIQ